MNDFLPNNYEPPKRKSYEEMTEKEREMHDQNLINYIEKAPDTPKNKNWKIFKARQFGMMNEFDEKYDSNRYRY